MATAPASDDRSDITEQTKLAGQQNANDESVSMDDASAITTSPGSLRSRIGHLTSLASDVVNDHIIVARYGTVACVTLLSAYGLSKTPFFFRYRTVGDIPSHMFAQRRTIHGRIMRVLDRNEASIRRNGCVGNSERWGENEEPIVLLVRQLSPVGRLLNRQAFDVVVNNSPMSSMVRRTEDRLGLLKVEVAGVKQPPYYQAPSHLEQAGTWLRGLADQRAKVSCQLLSRRVVDTSSAVTKHVPDPDLDQVAVCKVKYRPGMQFLRKDLGLSLVSFGRAEVASGINTENEDLQTVDGSTNIEDLRADGKYVKELADAEFDAIKGEKGMWSDEDIRKANHDIVEEASSEANAGFFRRLWNSFRNRPS